jgi:transcriptional regulator with XRE-family HTH domain
MPPLRQDRQTKTFNGVLGARIRELRLRRSLSQRGLARLSSLRPDALSRYEGGLHPPTVRSLCRISEALSVPVDCLLPEIALPEEHDRLLYQFFRDVWLLPGETRRVLATLVGCIATLRQELTPRSWSVSGGSHASSLR